MTLPKNDKASSEQRGEVELARDLLVLRNSVCFVFSGVLFTKPFLSTYLSFCERTPRMHAVTVTASRRRAVKQHGLKLKVSCWSWVISSKSL
jgi:hypothetical protein